MPSVQKVHVDKMLSDISIGYKNEAYIAEQIFKPVIVDKQSDRYYVFGKEQFRLHEDARAPGAEANEISWDFSDDAYFCEGHALRHAIADEETQNADPSFDLLSDGTELVTEGILINKEVDAASKLLDANNYAEGMKYAMGGQTEGDPVKWSDKDSTPQLDIAAAKSAMHKKAGLRPNTLVVSETVLNVLLLHPGLIALFANVERSLMTMDMLKAALNVDNILVGSALKSSATNANGTDTLSYIWGNSAVLCYVPSAPARKTPAMGYTFMWNKDGAGPIQVRQWYETPRRATIVEAERWYSQKIISNVAGFLFADAVTPIGETEE